jgi:hypothetical protein
MKTSVCPFCHVVSGVPHQTQQACIDALQIEIARTRQVLERRTEPLTAGAVRHDLASRRAGASSDESMESVFRMSLRRALES